MKPISQMNLGEIASFLETGEPSAYSLEQRLRELHEQTRWIPVSERMPEKDAYVLVWGFRCNELNDDDTEASVGSVMWESVDHSPCPSACYYGVWYKDITHWQRITPPEGV